MHAQTKQNLTMNGTSVYHAVNTRALFGFNLIDVFMSNVDSELLIA